MKKNYNRKAAVSGRFYPANQEKLKSTLSKLFTNTLKNNKQTTIRALIVPHAGYIYSGEVAASAYSRLNPNQVFDNIFILAPSHHMAFNGASVYNIGNYETPLGEVAVNKEIASSILTNCSLFGFYEDAHLKEHSIEVQLPFLQYWLQNPFKIVPILIGTKDSISLQKLSNTLKPYFTKNNLFVISSDFSHFPSYKDAIVADERMCDAIESKKISTLHKALAKNNSDRSPNLATSACGISGIEMLLNLVEEQKNLRVKKIKYMNSGNVEFGDKERVVGYLSFLVDEDEADTDCELTMDDKDTLLRLAHEAIEKRFEPHINNEINATTYSALLNLNFGVFISIYVKNNLKGCIGRFESSEPLHALCKKMAVASAFNDTRFKPVTKDELANLTIEISVLSPLKKITSIDEIEIGKHGILIKQGNYRGTLLPQVATNNNWDVEEFLGYCSKNKAGIGWEGWKTAEIYIYTATVFSDKT